MSEKLYDIDAATPISILKWKKKNPYDPSKPHHDTAEASPISIEHANNISESNKEHAMDVNSFIKLNESNMSEELKIALKSWDALYNAKEAFKPKEGHIKYIKQWIKKNYPKSSKSAQDRIAQVINMNKQGGAPPTESF